MSAENAAEPAACGGAAKERANRCPAVIMLRRLREEVEAEALAALERRGSSGAVDAAMYVAGRVGWITLSTGGAASPETDDTEEDVADPPSEAEPGNSGDELNEGQDEQATLRRGRREPKAVADCGVCDGRVSLWGQSVDAPSCVVTGSCEQIWYSLHPEHYDPDATAPVPDEMPCGGMNCTATLVFADDDGTRLEHPSQTGRCGVDFAGEVWHATGREMLNKMQPAYNIEEHFEPYDGM